MSEPMIQPHGVAMTPDWPAKIAIAQTQRTYRIEGVDYLRIPYGMEPWWDETCPPPTTPCRDCAVLPGQLHVALCAVERCARCKEGQWLICRDGCEGVFDEPPRPLQG